MVSKKQSTFYLLVIFLLIIALCIVFYFLCLKTKSSNKMIQNRKHLTKQSIEVVISRYNEDLKWTLEAPFNKYKYIVYNKGDNENYEKSRVLRSYNIKNQGKCDHTYLYHVVHNYKNVSDIVVFLPGCIDESYFKYSKAKLLFKMMEQYDEAFFIVDYKTKNPVLEDFYYFKVDDYKSMSQSNLEKNSEIDFRISKVRPYGKWYEENFQWDIHNMTLFGIFSISKQDILNHNQEYYYKLMKSLEGAVNDELSHYFEKSWEAVFYPLRNTFFLEYTNSITDIGNTLYSNYIKIYKDNYSLDLSASPVTGPIYWNIIYFINNNTYFNYNIHS